jgi:predicted small integral membrane protein
MDFSMISQLAFTISLGLALLMKGGFSLAEFGVVYEAVVSQLRLSRISRSVLTSGSMKIVGVIIALAVLGILGGLAFFNASQQKGINNSIGIAIIVLPVALLLWMVTTAISHGGGQ